MIRVFFVVIICQAYPTVFAQSDLDVSFLADPATITWATNVVAKGEPEAELGRARLVAGYANLNEGNVKIARRLILQAGLRSEDSSVIAAAVRSLIAMGELGSAHDLLSAHPKKNGGPLELHAICSAKARTPELLESISGPESDLVRALHAADFERWDVALKRINDYLEQSPYRNALAPLAYRKQAEWLEANGGSLERAYASAMMAFHLAWPGTAESRTAGRLAARHAIVFGHDAVAYGIAERLLKHFNELDLSHLKAYCAMRFGAVQSYKKLEQQTGYRVASGTADLFSRLARAKHLCVTKEYSKAVTAWEELLSTNETMSIAVFELAQLLTTCPDEAVRNGRRALSLIRNFRKSAGLGVWRTHLIECYAHAELGDFQQAKQSLERFANGRDGFGFYVSHALDMIQRQEPIRIDQAEESLWPERVLCSMPIAYSLTPECNELCVPAANNQRKNGRATDTESAIIISRAKLASAKSDEAYSFAVFAAKTVDSNPNLHSAFRPLLEWALHSGNPVPSSVSMDWSKSQTAVDSEMALPMLRGLLPAKRKTALRTHFSVISKLFLARKKKGGFRNSRFNASLSRAEFERGNFSKARALIDQALTNYRVHEDAFASETWLLRAQILGRSGNAQLALQNAIVAWRLRPETRGLEETLSLIHLKLGNWQAARFWTDRAMARMKDEPNAVTRLLLRRSEINRHSKASGMGTVIAASATSGQKIVTNAGGLTNAEGSRRTGVSTKSAGSVNAGLGTETGVPTDERSLVGTGDFAQADKDLRTALARLPKQLRSWDDHHTAWLVHVYAANVALRQGKEATAKRHLELAVQTEIENPAAVLSLIGLLTTARQADLRAPDQATVLLRQWQNRLGLDERFTIAQSCLTVSRGDFDTAIRQLRFARTLADDKSPAAKQMDRLLEHFQKRQLPTVIPIANVFFEAR